MLRFQASWLVEILIENMGEPNFNRNQSWFFPCMYQFMPLKWLGYRNSKITFNVPVQSQAILFKSWFGKMDIFPKDEVLKSFNQILMKNIDINLNPFRNWLNLYFTKEQLDYLLYWREAAMELNNQDRKESFLSIVSQVINYWLANNRADSKNIFQPDEILAYYYRQYWDFKSHVAEFKVTEQSLDEVKTEKCDTVVFNLIFSDEDYLENEAMLVYNAWVKGYTDIEESKQNFTNKLKGYSLELGTTKNFSFYKNMVIEAESAAFCWSGKGAAPKTYERLLVEPLQELLSFKYQRSKIFYKPIEPSSNHYDYILLFY